MNTEKNIILDEEEKFHDKWAESSELRDIHPIEFFTACTSPENRLILKHLKNLKGKKVLELGCGLGEASVYLAMQGADVTATDLSGGMLKTAEKLAAVYNVHISTQKCSADCIPFEDNTFDIVYAANLLHHVDIEKTVAESKRILKPNGIFVSWDPLIHNPVINVYRRMAKDLHTDDEHPLNMNQLQIFRKYFTKVSYNCTWFFTLIIFLKFYFIDKADVKTERYWKRILTEHNKLKPMYFKLEKMDKKFLKLFPFFRRFCWNIVIFARK